MANKLTKPIYPMGLEAEDQIIAHKGVLNDGLISHTSDAVLQVPQGDDTVIIDPSALRYNPETDEFEGSYSDGWRALGGGGIRWELGVGANNKYTPEVGRGYFIDSRTNAATVVLPANPKRLGLSVSFADLFGGLSVHPMKIQGNGTKIYGSVDDMVINTDYAAFTFTYTGAEQGWIVTSAAGLGSGRTYRRNVFETVLTQDTTFLDIGAIPEMVDIYVGGARLRESQYTLQDDGIHFTAVVPSGSMIEVLEYTPVQLADANDELAARVAAVESGKAKSGANNDITELKGLTTPLTVAQGGIGGNTPALGRKGLELDTFTKPNLLQNTNFELWNQGDAFPEAADNTITASRWVFGQTQGSAKFMVKKVSDVPNSQSRNSLRIEVTKANASPSADDESSIRQCIEGSMSVNSIAGRVLTLSFWAKSNVRGRHTAVFVKPDNSGPGSNEYSYCAGYDITNVETWEYKTILLDMKTCPNQLWFAGNDYCLKLRFGFYAGMNYRGNDGEWSNGNLSLVKNGVNLASAVGNFLQISQVKLEDSTFATPYPQQTLSQVIRDVSRYERVINDTDGVGSIGWSGYSDIPGQNNYQTIVMEVPMRVAPTVKQIGQWIYSSNTSNTLTFNSSPSSCTVNFQATAVGRQSVRSSVGAQLLFVAEM